MNRTGWIILAVVLLAVGLGSLFVEGIAYMTEETVLDAGPLEVTAEREERIALPPWLSGVLAGAGVLALVMGMRKPPAG